MDPSQLPRGRPPGEHARLTAARGGRLLRLLRPAARAEAAAGACGGGLASRAGGAARLATAFRGARQLAATRGGGPPTSWQRDTVAPQATAAHQAAFKPPPLPPRHQLPTCTLCTLQPLDRRAPPAPRPHRPRRRRPPPPAEAVSWPLCHTPPAPPLHSTTAPPCAPPWPPPCWLRCCGPRPPVTCATAAGSGFMTPPLMASATPTGTPTRHAGMGA